MHRQFKETVDLRAVQYVLSLSKEEFDIQFWQPDEINQKDGAKWDSKSYYKDVRSWCASLVHDGAEKGGDSISRALTYRFVLNQNCGRLYAMKPNFGVQGLQSRISSLLVKKYVRDIDMKNAHPTLLVYLCKRHDVDCPYLEAYVNNRAKICEKHGLEKRQILVAINKDKPVKTTSTWFRNFQTEMVQTREW